MSVCEAVVAPIDCKVCGGRLRFDGQVTKSAGTVEVARLVCDCGAEWEMTVTLRRKR